MDLNSSNLGLNKSFSAPDISNSGPLFRRVVIEECYYPYNHAVSPSKPSLTSSHNFIAYLPSSDSHFKKSEKQSIFQSIPNLNSSNWTDKATPHLQAEPKTPLALDQMQYDTPMDVDSINKTLEPDELSKSNIDDSIDKKPNLLDFVDLTYEGSRAILKKKIMPKNNKSKTQRKIKKPKRKTNFKGLIVKLTIVIVALAGIHLYDRFNYVRDIDLNNFQNTLNNLVIGQEQAIKQLTTAIYKFSNGSTIPERHLLSLIGTAGVGKSYCVNILKRNFMPNQIYEVDIDKFDLDSDVLSLSKSVPYLVIFDDLIYKKIGKLAKILESLPTDKWILVVSVFNIQETDDLKSFIINEELYDKIPEELSLLDYHYANIQFQSFNNDFAKDHIHSFRSVYKEFLNEINHWEQYLTRHDFERVGFKGLFEKMNVV